jgi:hypothetical protein
MKKVFLLLIFLAQTLFITAQINAITETGDEVVLYKDGTWIYVNDELNKESEIPVNPTEFTKAKKATFLVKSKTTDIGIWINPKNWKFAKATSNKDAEFEFSNKTGDLYGILITERMVIPLETLKSIAYENAKSAAPDVRIIKEEYRTVNGLKVLMMQMQGTIQGIKFVYFGYYYSYPGGTVQLLAYTSREIFNEKQDELETFLNGFVKLSN